MKRVGVFEGKTHFSSLVNRAAGGETIIVTRNGKAVAKIAPFEGAAEPEAAMARLLASTATLGGLTLEELRRSGRRY